MVPAAGRTDRPRRRHRGSVLLFVLILVVVTSAAIVKFSERALSEMAGEGYYVQRNRLRGEAYSALEATLAVLAEYREIDGGLFSPGQGWADPLALAEYVPGEGRTVQVEFADENAKLPLQSAETQEAALIALFNELGFDPRDVEILTDSLLDWIDADDNPRPFGAEEDEYRREDPPHLAANRPLRTFEELAAVQGFSELMFTETGAPTPQFEAFKQRVSLFSNGPLNLNTASDNVLRLTGMFTDNRLAALGAALDSPDAPRGSANGKFFKSIQDLVAQVGPMPAGPGLSIRSQVLSILITVREGKAEYRLRAVVQTSGSSTAKRPGPSSGGASLQPGNGKRTQVGATPGVGTDVVYPFRFLELVEDPPPTTISPLVSETP